MPETKQPGKVWLVGAGPGDAGLITLRGRQALDEADIVLFDNLVSDELLCSIKPTVRLVDVGKSAGSHPVPQEEINRILVEKAENGHRVVRLKGGDPFVFGRGSEELLALKTAGIPFEVVPGVTSAIGVPAYAGIPVTHRGMSASLHVLTWHSANGKAPDKKALEALVAAGGTIVILMGSAKSQETGRLLIEAGFNPETPASIISRGATAGQIKKSLTLEQLANETEAVHAKPALIVVGKVCSLGGELSWAESRPLHGARVVVTRPEPKNVLLCEKIRMLGGEAIVFPCIDTFPKELNENSLREASGYDWLVFTSVAGVEAFFGRYLESGPDIRRLAACQFAVIGPATSLALRTYGIRHDYMPGIYDALHLGEGLAALAKPGETVLLVRAEKGSPELQTSLDQAGIQTSELAVYSTFAAQGNDVARRIIEHLEFDYLTFTSASTVRSFAQNFPGLDFTGIRAVCIGEPTAKEAQVLGLRTEIAQTATEDGVCSTLEVLHERRN